MPPLKLIDDLASKMGGKMAYLVDEDNNVTYIGKDVDQTTREKVREAMKKLV